MPRQPASLRPLLIILALACAAPTLQADTLPEVVRLALAHDPQVRSARALWQATQAQTRQVRSRWWPSAGVNAQVGQADVTDLNRDLNRRTERAEAYVRLNVYNGGADQALLQSTEQEQHAARLDLSRALQEAAQQTAQAYVDAQRQQGLLDIARRRLSDVQTLATDVDRLVSGGKSPESDRHAAQASLADAQAAHDAAAVDAALARRRLQTLVGAPVGDLQPVDLPDLSVDQALDTPPGTAQARNPAWLAAQARASSAQLKLGPIQPELLPKVDLEWRQLLSERTTPTPSSGQQRGWTLSIGYDLPLGGASFAKRDEGLARAAAAEGDTDRIARTIDLDLDNALQTLHRSRQLTPIYQRQIRHLEAVVSASTLQYAAGRRDLIDLISLREAPFNIRQRLIDNDSQRQKATLAYWTLTGQLLSVLGLSSLEP